MSKNAWIIGAFYIFFVCGIVGVLIDLDHIWSIFGVPEPITFTGWYSRPFHTALIFILVGFIASGFITALTYGSDNLGQCLELLDKRIGRRVSFICGGIRIDVDYGINSDPMVVEEVTGEVGDVQR